jgi:adenylate kinase
VKLILLGAPGAGKGTQADLLSARLKVPTISTGNMLRAAIKNRTTIGQMAEEYINRGALVPDEVVLGILAERLQQEDCRNGYILDGVPRTVHQAETLEKTNVAIDAAIYLDVSDETIIRRMSGRRVCPNCGQSYHVQNMPPKQEGICDKCGAQLVQRADDTPEIVQQRLAVYHKETEPLCDFYEARGLLKPVRTVSPVEAVLQEILSVLGV